MFPTMRFPCITNNFCGCLRVFKREYAVAMSGTPSAVNITANMELEQKLFSQVAGGFEAGFVCRKYSVLTFKSTFLID